MLVLAKVVCIFLLHLFFWISRDSPKNGLEFQAVLFKELPVTYIQVVEEAKGAVHWPGQVKGNENAQDGDTIC